MSALLRSRFSASFAFLLVSLPVIAQSQFGIVEGYVDGPDKKGLPDAIVALDRLDYQRHIEVKTDKKGRFQIFSVPSGDYALTITVNGQVREKRDFFHVSPGRQSETAGMSAMGYVFTLKPPDVEAEELKKEAAKASKEQTDASSKAREEALKKQTALNQSYGAGKTALEAKQYDVAVDNLLKAAEVDPKQAAVWSSLADAYLGEARQKPAEAPADIDKAREAFAKAVELKPADAGQYNNFALVLAESNKFDEAKQNLAKAIEIDPAGAGKYYYNLGVLLLNKGQNDSAVEEFKHAIDTDPNYAEAQYQYGVALMGKATTDKSGKIIAPPGAVEALQKYLSLKPDGPNAESAKELIATLGGSVSNSYRNPSSPSKK